MTRLPSKLLISLAFVVIVAEMRAEEPALAAGVRQLPYYDLYQMAQKGDPKHASEAVAEFRRRAALGDLQAAGALDGFLEGRASTGDDAAVSELLSRAKAGDKAMQNMMVNILDAAAAKGSQAALAELRRRANSAKGRDRWGAEASFDGVLMRRAAAGDKVALAELRQRASEGSAYERLSKKPFLDEALKELASLGDPEVLDELRRAAEKGDGGAQYSLGYIYYNGTAAIKRDLAMSARVQGCPVPDESILNGCRSVTVDQLPSEIKNLMKSMTCDDDYPAPVALNLDATGTPQYKVSCWQASHGPSQAVLFGKSHGHWRNLASMWGYEDQCLGFFPLRTEHAGFRDICLEDFCALPTKSSPPLECKRVILKFTGLRYQEH